MPYTWPLQNFPAGINRNSEGTWLKTRVPDDVVVDVGDLATSRSCGKFYTSGTEATRTESVATICRRIIRYYSC